MESFNKVAHHYLRYNWVQEKIISILLPWVKGRVLDLGAGPVPLCHKKGIEFYLGVDSAPQMATLNPCPVIVADFDHFPLEKVVSQYQITQIISFSALQWSQNLPNLLSRIGKTDREYLLALFTNKTFQKLHDFLGTTSPLPSPSQIEKWGKTFLPNLQITPFHFSITFPSGRSLFQYLKWSGVATGSSAPLSKLFQFAKTPPFLTLQLEIVALHPSYSIPSKNFVHFWGEGGKS